MSLFGIERYTDGDHGDPKEQSAEKILADIHRKAELRKKKQTQLQGKRKSEDATTFSPEVKKPKADVDDINASPTKHTPKKKKKKLSSAENIKKESFESPKVEIKTEDETFNDSSVIKKETDDESSSEEESDESSEEEEDEEEEDGKEEGKEDEEGGGFTVIGDVNKKKIKQVHRVLPDWLAHPSVIKADIRNNKCPLEEMTILADDIRDRLKAEGITHLFPVQAQVIPALLDSCSTGFLSGKAGYCPSDICCSAPTGSGKTLAFVLPIVQALRARRVPCVRALVVLPVVDLASQVYSVFSTYCQNTPLKVAKLIGQKTVAAEQASIVKKGIRGYESLVDIIVATPGRLVDHLNNTDGFSLKNLRFLVLDEADRMMEEFKQDWLTHVERASNRPSLPLTVNRASELEMPLQKLLFSATLSQNPEKLQQLKLFHPKLFTSIVKTLEKPAEDGDHSGELECMEAEKGSGEFVGKYTTPSGLTEFYIESDLSQKPLTVLYMLHHLKFRRVLCFTNSVENTHRLYHLVQLVGGGINVQEFSSSLNVHKRRRMLKQFSAGKIDMLLCSDAMARGMDVAGVQYVLSYEAPPYLKTYIHRVGRTARAGKAGTAITLLQKKEIFRFKKMCKDAGKDGLKEMSVKKGDLAPYVDSFQDALRTLPDVLRREKQKK